MSEAGINDEALVNGLDGDADLMTIVVRHSVSPISPCDSYCHLTEYHILCHRRIFSHRVI